MTGPTSVFVMSASAMLFAGVMTMAFRDLMDINHFHFPIHWVWLSQVGYLMLLPVYRLTCKSQDQGRLPFVHGDAHGMPFKVYVVCMLLDSGCLVFIFLAMGLSSAALVQMMRGAKLIFTFVISVKVMGMKQYAYHYLGILLTVIGLLIVIAGSQTHSSHHNSHHKSKLGGSGHGVVLALFFCLVGELFNSILFVYQEHTMKKYAEESPLKLVGTMGAMGTVIFTIVLVVVNMMSVESTPKAIEKMANSGSLTLTILVYTVFCALFDLAGVWVSKEGSAVSRAMVDILRSACIWAVELSFQWLDFKMLHLLGFSVVVLGTLVYNGWVIIPGLEPPQDAETNAVSKAPKK